MSSLDVTVTVFMANGHSQFLSMAEPMARDLVEQLKCIHESDSDDLIVRAHGECMGRSVTLNAKASSIDAIRVEYDDREDD